MTNHICEAPKHCICRMDAVEPDELCPRHGVPKKPERCIHCNKFMGVYKPKSLMDFFKKPKEIK